LNDIHYDHRILKRKMTIEGTVRVRASPRFSLDRLISKKLAP
jgi:hypothetical protein